MISLKIHYKDNSGAGARIDFKGNKDKALALLEILTKQIEASTDAQTLITGIKHMDATLELKKTDDYTDKMLSDIHSIIDAELRDHNWHGSSCGNCDDLVRALADYVRSKILYYANANQEKE